MLKIKKIKPLFNYLITTMDKYEEDGKSGDLIIKQAGTLKEYQHVIAVGPMVKEIKEGDLVMIDPTRYAVKKHQEGSLKDGVITDNPIVGYNFRTVEIEEEDYLLLTDSDIRYIVEDYEEETPALITIPKQELVLN